MRYPQGSIQLNPSRDLPLLRQIVRSEFVTHSQLFEFMRLNHHEPSRKSFDWRLRRLVDHGLVRRQTTPGWAGDFMYSVANRGTILLQGMGEYSLIGRDRFYGKEAERSVFHAMELNDIQLSALRAGLLVRWVGSLEVRSQNELTGFGFAKDYDAIVTTRSETGEQRFALEYERSAKAMRYYKEVSVALAQEARVGHVLYLVSNYDLLQFVSSFFRDSQCRVLFGLVKDWHARLLEMPLSSHSVTRAVRLGDALKETAPDPNRAAISA
jgi:hypothetical protein